MFSLTVMMYHYVRDPGDAAQANSGIPGLPTAQFNTQLDTLARDYEMISWDDLRAALLQQKNLPERACLLTFDDGVCDHYLNVFPALHARNLSGIFFALAHASQDELALGHKLHYLLACLGVDGLRRAIWKNLNPSQREQFVTAEARYRQRWHSELDVFKGVLQRDLADEINPLLSQLLAQHVAPESELAHHHYLDDAQIQEMRAGGMHFGGHSRTHPWFDCIDAPRRADEIRASQHWLESVEDAPFAFAYPYGGLADDAPALLSNSNFLAAFTTREATTHVNPFYIGRFDGEELQNPKG
ncbi:MAG TPA: polysaccharide deacetylase family protein [Anaerolineae bacterium]|nr:polysaccharide deacetylase family protein [Anaerolineae bacterium]